MNGTRVCGAMNSSWRMSRAAAIHEAPIGAFSTFVLVLILARVLQGRPFSLKSPATSKAKKV